MFVSCEWVSDVCSSGLVASGPSGSKGVSGGGLGALQGGLRGVQGGSSGPLGELFARFWGSWAALVMLLEVSWEPLGAFWELLGPSWELLGHLGTLLGGPKGQNPQNPRNLEVFEGFMGSQAPPRAKTPGGGLGG